MEISAKDSLVTLVANQESHEAHGLSLSDKLHDEQIKDGTARRKARGWLHGILLVLLSFEILFIAYIMISQGIKTLLFTHIPFALSEWEFAPFVNVAILQTCYLIHPIVWDLFPGQKKKKNKSSCAS